MDSTPVTTFKVYECLRPKVGDYPFTWVLDYRKLVQPVQEEVPPCLPFTYTVCPFTEFFRHADAESYFDVKAIVIHAFPRKQVKPKSSQRDLVIIDERKMPLILTLWDEFGDKEGLEIANLFPAITIIIAQNVKATTFHGKHLKPYAYCFRFANVQWPVKHLQLGFKFQSCMFCFVLRLITR